MLAPGALQALPDSITMPISLYCPHDSSLRSLAKEIVDAYLAAQFEGGRHARRVEKIPVKSKISFESQELI